MSREEMFTKSQIENEQEIFVLKYAGKKAAQVGMLVCCLIAIIQVYVADTISFESWMVYFSVIGTICTVKYLKLRNKAELVMSILYWGLFFIFTVLFIVRLFA